MAQGPEAVDIGARLSSMQQGPTSSTIPGLAAALGAPIQRPSISGISLFSGNIGGPFGLKPKQGGLANQLAYEQQCADTRRQEGLRVLAEACAAAAPVAAQIQQASVGDIQGHGLPRGFGASGSNLIEI